MKSPACKSYLPSSMEGPWDHCGCGRRQRNAQSWNFLGLWETPRYFRLAGIGAPVLFHTMAVRLVPMPPTFTAEGMVEITQGCSGPF